VTILNGEVVMRTINIGRNDGGEVTVVLFRIGTIQCIDEAFGIGISLIGWMRRSIVKHGFVDGIFGFVGENACGEEGNEFFHLVDSAAFHDVIIDDDVLTVKLNLWTISDVCRL